MALCLFSAARGPESMKGSYPGLLWFEESTCTLGHTAHRSQSSISGAKEYLPVTCLNPKSFAEVSCTNIQQLLAEQDDKNLHSRLT